MNLKQNMIIIKGEIKTAEIESCRQNPATQKIEVVFDKGNGKKYQYSCDSVEWLKDPKVLNPDMCRIRKAGRDIFDIKEIYAFEGRTDTYLHICFKDDRWKDYPRSELTIVESCLDKGQAGNVFAYIKQTAGYIPFLIIYISNIRRKGKHILSSIKEFQNMIRKT